MHIPVGGWVVCVILLSKSKRSLSPSLPAAAPSKTEWREDGPSLLATMESTQRSLHQLEISETLCPIPNLRLFCSQFWMSGCLSSSQLPQEINFLQTDEEVHPQHFLFCKLLCCYCYLQGTSWFLRPYQRSTNIITSSVRHRGSLTATDSGKAA